MPTFILSRDLGWAHRGNQAVICRLVTARDHNMLIPGGALILGEVDYDLTGVHYYEPRCMPEAVKQALNAAIAANESKEEQIRQRKSWAPQRLAYLPTSVSDGVADENGTPMVYIIAFTADEAVKAAYAAGLRVQAGYLYGGPGEDDEYHGLYWIALVEHQRRQESSS